MPPMLAGRIGGAKNRLWFSGLGRRVIVDRGDRPQRTEDGIDVLPVAAFLAALDDRRLW
ncbi:MAG: hypothetical protein WCJ31_08540 [Planctomycetia bacterium]